MASTDYKRTGACVAASGGGEAKGKMTRGGEHPCRESERSLGKVGAEQSPEELGVRRGAA